MNKIFSLGLIGLTALFLFSATGCTPDPEFGNLNLSLSGLEDLGDDYVYEGWMMVSGAPVSTGTFTVDANGNPSSSSFQADYAMLKDATAFILSIEPAVDSDPAPSNTKILAGSFSGSSASLAISDANAVGTDFDSATGLYFLATPTNGPASNETSGIWFMDPANGTAGLTLPTLGAGWIYEGWVVIDGIPVSTGTFRSGDMADSGNPHSGTQGAPAVPGEDFFVDAPAGLNFNIPPDLAGKTAVVSVEPVPDNTTAPFVLKPLTHGIPVDAVSGPVYTMDNAGTANQPTGTATR